MKITGWRRTSFQAPPQKQKLGKSRGTRLEHTHTYCHSRSVLADTSSEDNVVRTEEVEGTEEERPPTGEELQRDTQTWKLGREMESIEIREERGERDGGGGEESRGVRVGGWRGYVMEEEQM